MCGTNIQMKCGSRGTLIAHSYNTVATFGSCVTKIKITPLNNAVHPPMRLHVHVGMLQVHAGTHNAFIFSGFPPRLPRAATPLLFQDPCPVCSVPPKMILSF